MKMGAAFSLIKTLLIAYAAICVFMWAYQRQLLYVPMRGIEAPEQYGLQGFEVFSLTSIDNVTTQGWHHNAKSGFPVIVYFHGNGGNLSHRAHYFQQMIDAGFGILAIDYRGYGASEGSPSEQGFYADARALLEYGHTQLHIRVERMIFYGESIGTGVAVQMATEYSPAAIILQSPYTSITSLGIRNYPWLPVKLLLRDTFDSMSKIASIDAPLLLIHGEQDSIVPVQEGKNLFTAAPQPKEAIYYPEYGHGNMNHEKMVAAIREFCAKYKLINVK